MLDLRPPRLEDEEELLQAHEVFKDEGFVFLPQIEAVASFSAWLDLIEQQGLGEHLPPGHVPATFLVAALGERIVGRAYIRHELNEFLRNNGDHVGYGVFRQHRGRGYGTQIPSRSLEFLAAVGVDHALVTVARSALALTGAPATPCATPRARWRAKRDAAHR